MPLSFHIRHEVKPERAKDVLDAICEGQSYSHVIQGDRQAARLRQLGLAEGDEATALGQSVHQLCIQKPDLWGELLHFSHYILWQNSNPLDNGFSWTYRQFVNYLWQQQEADLTDEFIELTVAYLTGEAEQAPYFADEIARATLEGTVSLSHNSLKGAYYWLEELQPSVLENERFTRRAFCHPELMLLACGWVGQTQGGAAGVDFLLTAERREAICQLCLLDFEVFDSVLDWMLPLYPTVVHPGTSAGVYGRFIHFTRWPEIPDLLT